MRLTLFCLLTASVATMAAPVPPTAAQLLPPDTLAVFSVPDWDKAVGVWKNSAYGKLWVDPALQTFREKLVLRWSEEYAAPLERRLGVKLADYLDLLHGQVTVGLIPNGWGTDPNGKPGIVILIDAKDKQAALKTRLADLRKKWAEAGKPMKTERIHDVEFTTLILPAEDPVKPSKASRSDEKDDDSEAGVSDKPAGPSEVTFGQSGSLLLVTSVSGEMERTLARQIGGPVPSLAEQGIFDANYLSLFREATAFGWVNFARVYETFAKQLGGAGSGARAENPMMPRTDKLLAASGLSGLKSIAARLGGGADGLSAEVFLTIPEARRQGLFRLVAMGRKEAGPPAFVGADVVKFNRWRIDGQKGWNIAENILTAISPEIAGLLQMGLQAAGKDADPNFDLKATLVGNLGDDFIRLEKSPAGQASGEAAARTLFLVGSAKPEQVVQGVKAATSLMPMAGGEPNVQQREFLGKKIYSLALPSTPTGESGKPAAAADSRSFNFSAGGGYAVLSSDPNTVEEYLRNAESPSKTLREIPGLDEAAQRIGGMSNGSFGYVNQAETTRTWLESAKHESAALDKLLSLAPLAGGKSLSRENRDNMRGWFDASALPPYEKVAKYFHFFVYSLSASEEEGLSWKWFAPTPPKLKQP